MNSSTSRPSYALVTPARNEAQYLEKTIISVVAQTVRPVRWVIVSDASTDGTDDIIRRYADVHPWIRWIRLDENRDRSFAAKAGAFNAGHQLLQDVAYDIVGNLDADITFDHGYYEFLLGRFQAMPELGVAGTPYIEDESRPQEHTYAHKRADLTHVSGACQMFRRGCFEQVGGYTPIRGGGIDWVAVTTARMKGWRTQTFLDKVCVHHRRMGTAKGGPLSARFRHGKEDYYLGSHPLWQVSRALFQMRSPPVVVGGVMLMAGYLSAMLSRTPRPIPDELVAFHRKEQLARLSLMLPWVSRSLMKAKGHGAARQD
jgi:glycosyltransferase involved in cell wall biosynthesis